MIKIEPFAKITIKTSPRIRSIFRIYEQFNYYSSVYIYSVGTHWTIVELSSQQTDAFGITCIERIKNNRTETGSRRWRLFKSQLLASVHKTSAVFSEFSLLRLQLSSLSLSFSVTLSLSFALVFVNIHTYIEFIVLFNTRFWLLMFCEAHEAQWLRLSLLYSTDKRSI